MIKMNFIESPYSPFVLLSFYQPKFGGILSELKLHGWAGIFQSLTNVVRQIVLKKNLPFWHLFNPNKMLIWEMVYCFIPFMVYITHPFIGCTTFYNPEKTSIVHWFLWMIPWNILIFPYRKSCVHSYPPIVFTTTSSIDKCWYFTIENHAVAMLLIFPYTITWPILDRYPAKKWILSWWT